MVTLTIHIERDAGGSLMVHLLTRHGAGNIDKLSLLVFACDVWQKCVKVIVLQKLGRVCAWLQLQPRSFLHPETPTEAPPCGPWTSSVSAPC